MAWGGSCACGAGRADICMQAMDGCGVPWDGVGFSETYAWCVQRLLGVQARSCMRRAFPNTGIIDPLRKNCAPACPFVCLRGISVGS